MIAGGKYEPQRCNSIPGPLAQHTVSATERPCNCTPSLSALHHALELSDCISAKSSYNMSRIRKDSLTPCASGWGSPFPSGCLRSARTAPQGRCFVPESAGKQACARQAGALYSQAAQELAAAQGLSCKEGSVPCKQAPFAGVMSGAAVPAAGWDRKDFGLSTVEPLSECFVVQEGTKC